MTHETDIFEYLPSLKGSAALRYGLERLNAGFCSEALHILSRAMEDDLQNPIAQLALGTAALRTGDFDCALNVLASAAIPGSATEAKALHGAGLALAALDRREAALVNFRRAAQLTPNAWTIWDSVADITADEAERVRALNLSADALLSACASGPLTSALARNCVRRLIDAGRAAEVVRLVQDKRMYFVVPGEADTRLANAYYNLGDFRRAFELQARATAETEPAPDAPSRVSPEFKTDTALSALRDVTAFFAAKGLHLFLTAGTLLGFERDGGPLPYDRDVDAGLLVPPDTRYDIAALLREHPRLTMPRCARPRDRYFGIVYQDTPIDLFVHELRSGQIVCGFSEVQGDIQWGYTPFSLAEVVYRGQTWYVPQAPGLFLEQTYGPGWRKPDPGFSSVVSSPALQGTSLYARSFYAAARARQSILSGDFGKAKALARQSPIAFALPPTIS